MAKNNENILDKARTAGLARPEAGMRVPEGYFEAFAERMSSVLPPRPELEESEAVAPKGLWATVRPYVYMAAMFAGVWCMLHVFHSITGKGELAPMDRNPVLASALATDDFVYDYVLPEVSARDVVDQFVDEGLFDESFDMSDFSEDLTAVSDSNQILPQ